MIRFHAFCAGKGYAAPDSIYRSRFNRFWWFWVPRLHLQKPQVLRGYHNPRVIRLIWLCFAVGADIGFEGTKPP